MTEREMEDLLAASPEKFFPRRLLTLKGRQVELGGDGRFDLEFEDQDGNSHLMELKAVPAKLEHVEQLTRYKKALEERGRKRIFVWLVAPRIPRNLREFLDDNSIEYTEIHEAEFRHVARDVGYEFQSEKQAPVPTPPPTGSASPRGYIRLPSSRSKVEQAWYFWRDPSGNGRFLAFVNAKGNCSIRLFDADTGALLGKQYQAGDFQDAFREYITSGVKIFVSHQPNLEKHCKEQLPSLILGELRRQIPGSPVESPGS